MDTETPQATIQHRNPQTQAGFTMVPNVILTAAHLSQGARLLYALLKMYAWQSGNAWPGMDRLAGELGVSTRQTHTYMNELSAARLITVERRGLTQTNRYIIEDIPDDFTSDRKCTSDQEAKPTSDQDRNPTSDKEDSGNKTQKKKRETTPAHASAMQETTGRGDTQTPPPSRRTRTVVTLYQPEARGDISPVACKEPGEPEVTITVPPGTPVNRRPDAPPVLPRPKLAPIPPDWAPSPALIERAGQDYPHLTAKARADATRRFRLHYQGEGKPAADWGAKWLEWLDREADYARKDAPPTGPPRRYMNGGSPDAHT